MRKENMERKTKETEIAMELDLDGNGTYEINTGIEFFDHMLAQVAKHGSLNLKVSSKGDLEVDSHHLIEDTGIVFGQLLSKIIKDQKLMRYGDSIMPMDDALIITAIDLCNRGNFSMAEDYFTVPKIGEMDTEMVYEFFKAIAYNAKINIHILKMRGFNNHHIAEAMFKGFGAALKKAVIKTDELLTTKGVL